MALHTRVELIDTLLEEADQKGRRCITPSLPKSGRRKKDSTLAMIRLSRQRERP